MFEIKFLNHQDSIGFHPELVKVAVRFAFELFFWWEKHELAIPSVVPSSADPGFFDDDRDWGLI
jgi:hypothetical protein